MKKKKFNFKSLIDKDFQLSFSQRLEIDYTSGVAINGKRFWSTKDGGTLIVHPDGITQWISKNFYDMIHCSNCNTLLSSCIE